MVKVQHFDASNFERNISEIGERVSEHQDSFDEGKRSEKEIVRESIKSLGENSGKETEEEEKGIENGGKRKEEREDFLPNYLGTEREPDVREALERLAVLALHGNLMKSLEEARRLTPFLEDAFHDALVDKILPEMKKRGLL